MDQTTKDRHPYHPLTAPVAFSSRTAKIVEVLLKDIRRQIQEKQLSKMNDSELLELLKDIRDVSRIYELHGQQTSKSVAYWECAVVTHLNGKNIDDLDTQEFNEIEAS